MIKYRKKNGDYHSVVGDSIILEGLTTQEIENLTPEDGTIVYNVTRNEFQGYRNERWEGLGSNRVEQRTTNTITWDVDANYGTRNSPLTGVLSEEDIPENNVGVVAKIFYNNDILDVPETWNFGSSISIFEADITCVIYVEYESDSFKIANIIDLS